MRLPDVWCVVTGVWPLTPSRPPACLPVRLHLTGGDMASPTHTDTRSRLPHTGQRDTVTVCVGALIFFLFYFVHAKLHHTQFFFKATQCFVTLVLLSLFCLLCFSESSCSFGCRLLMVPQRVLTPLFRPRLVSHSATRGLPLPSDTALKKDSEQSFC